MTTTRPAPGLADVIYSATLAMCDGIANEPQARQFSRDIAAAVAAHLASDAVIDRGIDAFLTEACRQEGERPPDLDKMKREETPGDRQKVRAVMRAAVAAGVGEAGNG